MTEKAKCKICQTIVNRKRSNTSGMWDHLHRHHIEIHSSIKGQKNQAPIQPKISEHAFFPLGSAEKKLIDRALVEFVVGGFHSFRIVEEDSFKKFCKTLNPKYQPPSCQTIANNLLDNAYQECLDRTLQDLMNLPNGHLLTLTTDGWQSTDRDHSKYNSLTASYFEPESSQIKTRTLGIKPNCESQTSQLILR